MNIKINKEFIKKELKKYTNKWDKTSDEYKENNVYDWLIDNIEQEFKTVLEIGCGNGNSTIKLLDKAEKIISIDDNIECLNRTYEKLKGLEIDVILIKRESLLVKSEKEFSTSYSKIDMEKYRNSKVLLIQGDMIEDVNLINFLKQNFKFDLVACWFMGTNTIKPFNTSIKEANIKTDWHYRQLVQQNIFNLYKEIKSKDGMMQVVDRGHEDGVIEFKKYYKSFFENCVKDSDIKIKTVSLSNNGGIPFVESDNANQVGNIQRQNITMSIISCLIKKDGEE